MQAVLKIPIQSIFGRLCFGDDSRSAIGRVGYRPLLECYHVGELMFERSPFQYLAEQVISDVSAGIKGQHFAGFVVGEAGPPIGGDAVRTLHQILNSPWHHRSTSVTIELALTGRVVADGLSDVRFVLDAGPRQPERSSSVRRQLQPSSSRPIRRTVMRPTPTVPLNSTW